MALKAFANKEAQHCEAEQAKLPRMINRDAGGVLGRALRERHTLGERKALRLAGSPDHKEKANESELHGKSVSASLLATSARL